ncbi:CobW/HypB/UreG, nucleotide-binding domain-domain-containing protein [Naematelia encephala]|uniref:CobW/HypB/UreG, nucleotide-binding domain-domain-containing protein n=1 Tax=Naematelia encephala TaxID=71784 RepID=A0A1Y2ASR5_9TREE|nr:CobW/HypB/UreG, nucleotide-binding domain-domain-containing protein [Naematelia encephala]
MATNQDEIPVTLLTGYLGAGKSTLVDYILKADHGYKVAVCMNDFGDTTDIESRALTINDPVTGEQTSAFLTLPNGCLCCSFKDLGIAAVEDMVARQPVDWVIIELTGLADPGPVAKSFWTNEEMGDLELDAVVCVIDGRNVLKQISEPTLQRQIALADLLLLNKTDLITSSSDLTTIESRIRSLNPSAPLRRTERSRADLSSLFRVGAYSGGAQRGIGTLLDSSSTDNHNNQTHEHDHQHDENCSHDHQISHHHKPHYDGITTISISLPPLSPDKFKALNTFLQDTLWEPHGPHGPEILRTKGLVVTTQGEEWIIQGVADLFEVTRAAPAPNSKTGVGKDQEGKLVFIGKGVGPELARACRHALGL